MPRIPLAFAGVIVVALLALALPSSASADTVVRSIPVLDQPTRLVVTPDGSTVVSVSATNELRVTDVATGVQGSPVALGSTAYNITMSPDGATVVVPTSIGDLWFVATSTGAVTGPVHIDSYLFDVAFSPDGVELYATTGQDVVIVVSAVTHVELRRFVVLASYLYGIEVTPDGTGLVLASPFQNKVYQARATDGLFLSSYPVPPQMTDVILSPDGSRAYLSSLANNATYSLDLASGTVTTLVLGGTGPVSGLALSPDGTKLSVARGFGNEISVIDTVTNTALAPVVTGVDTRGIAFTADGTLAFAGDVTNGALLVIAVDRPPLLAAAAPAATIGAPYAVRLLKAGSPAPTLTLTGVLPDGLTLNAATGELSGTPTALGTFSFFISASNGFGTATQAYNLTMAAAPALATTGTDPAPLVAGAAALVVLGLALRRRRQVQ
jgi:MYXO-CTERM domain-containing protein